VLLLNYLYLNRPLRMDRVALQRHPNVMQADLFRRVRMLVGVWCRDTTGVDLCCGRRGSALQSQLMEMQAASEHLKLKLDPYNSLPDHSQVQSSPTPLPQAAEGSASYGELVAVRIKLEGRFGHWAASDYLPPHPWLGLNEPLSLRRSHVNPDDGAWQKRKGGVTRDEKELFDKMAAAPLLKLRWGPVCAHLLTRLVKAWKDSSHDRLIGDRREAERDRGQARARTS
jgi:hypothetical protein